MDKAAILAITQPEKLFDQATVKQQYRRLANQWHPDKGGDEAVFIHVQRLYDAAIEKLNTGLWLQDNCHVFKTTLGKKFKVKYLHRVPFELGETLIGQGRVCYILDKKCEDLWMNAICALGMIKFNSDKYKEEFGKSLPGTMDAFETYECDSGTLVVMVKKKPEFLRLEDVLIYSGEFQAEHVAWIISRLLNICVFLSINQITHNAITTENVYISPQNHWCGLFGGWWYAMGIGEKMVAVPKKTREFMPSSVLKSKIASITTDLEMVKALGRELLTGDPSGANLHKASAPDALKDWLRLPVGGDEKPIAVFRNWYDITIPKAFGERKFVEMNITQSDIYKG